MFYMVYKFECATISLKESSYITDLCIILNALDHFLISLTPRLLIQMIGVSPFHTIIFVSNSKYFFINPCLKLGMEMDIQGLNFFIFILYSLFI